MIVFFKNLIKYWDYCCFSAGCKIRKSVAGTRLGVIWLIIEPVLMMFTYAWVYAFLFQKRMTYLLAYICSGLALWNLFQGTVKKSMQALQQGKGFLTKKYMPKYVLLISLILEDLYLLLIQFMMVATLFCIYDIPLSWYILELIPIILIIVLLSLGVGLWLMHFKVYLCWLDRIVAPILRVIFYFSGVFYSLDGKLGAIGLRWLFKWNPMAALLYDARNALLYQTGWHADSILKWFIFSVALVVSGATVVQHYEGNYFKNV